MPGSSNDMARKAPAKVDLSSCVWNPNIVEVARAPTKRIWTIIVVVTLRQKIGQRLGGCYWNTALMNMMGSLVTMIMSICWKPSLRDWVLGWNIRLLASIFSGVVVSGMAFAATVWCVDAKSLVFESSPIQLVVVALVAATFLGESIYVGSIVGAVVIVVGLYLVLWAKKKESRRRVRTLQNNNVFDSLQNT